MGKIRGTSIPACTAIQAGSALWIGNDKAVAVSELRHPGEAFLHNRVATMTVEVQDKRVRDLIAVAPGNVETIGTLKSS
jgi:hypothetical protein